MKQETETDTDTDTDRDRDRDRETEPQRSRTETETETERRGRKADRYKSEEEEEEEDEEEEDKEEEEEEEDRQRIEETMGEQQQDSISKDEVRTLFISGLPDDVKEREIYNLFRSYSGYESCQLKYTGRGYQIVAFAVFEDQQSALNAKEALNETKFDPDLSTTLHIELARANSRAKRHRGDEGAFFSMEKKSRGPKGLSHSVGDHGVGGTMHLSGYGHSVYNDLSGYPPTQSVPPPYSVHDNISSMMMGSSLLPPAPLPSPGSNPPCSTLFIANLGLSCTEAEMYHVLSSFPGFIKLKMQTKAGLPVAFVDFADEACSTQALSQLQNYMLPSSDRGGMRLEYAKARMGLPRRERRG